MRLIVCGGCDVKNRVNALSLRRVPKCGNCGRLLPEPRATRWARLVVKHRRYIVVAMSILAVAVVGGVLLFDQHQILLLEAVPRDALAIALLILFVVFAVVALTSRTRPSYDRGISQTERELVGGDLKNKIERLVKVAWGVREDSANLALDLRADAISRLGQYELIVTALLKHVRRVAPGLSVPMMTQVVVERLPDAAGQFVEDDGWVKIVIGSDFLREPAAAQAILCHELCHYVLGANGIREPTTKANERLTDVAMFVFGSGDIFLAGYRTTPGVEYRSGHRLGYLNDAEYENIRDHVAELRRTGHLQPTKAAGLELRLKSAIPDARVRKRLLEGARAKDPTRSASELIELVLEAYERDRR
jgi:hypothetical protein